MTKIENLVLDELHTVWFDSTNASKFEPIRELILQDTQVNVFDYKRGRLVIEHQIKYGVVFHGSTPIMCGGLFDLGGYARVLNRFYIFPEYRGTTLKDFKASIPIWIEKLVNPLLEMSTFDTHVLTHVNKSNKKNFNEWYIRALNEYVGSEKWFSVDGLVKTRGDDMDPRAWQWCMTDNPKYPFRKISMAQWEIIKKSY
jgi:hypothetical protein